MKLPVLSLLQSGGRNYKCVETASELPAIKLYGITASTRIGMQLATAAVEIVNCLQNLHDHEVNPGMWQTGISRTEMSSEYSQPRQVASSRQ